MIEAAQQIPHPLDEVNLDFEVSGGARDGNDDQITITACRKEIVEDYVAVMELAGQRVPSLRRSLLQFPYDKP